MLPSGITATGYPAVAEQCRRMGVVHDDWQQGLGRALLAKREGGLYAAGVGGVVLSTCRQVGKTFTFGTIIFALCILFPGTTVLWTAHHSRTSDETFATLDALTLWPKIAPFTYRSLAGNGKQTIRFRNKSRILFGAREHGFGRGIPGVSIVVFDEAQILKQSALNDMIPAANTVKNPLVLYMGTPPDMAKEEERRKAEVFAARRTAMLEVAKQRAAGEVVESNTLYVEIGADPGSSPDDRSQWAKGNPSYPFRTPDESILRLREQLADDDAFLREAMGVWPDVSVSSIFPAGVWENQAADARRLVSPVLAVDMRSGLERSASWGVAGGVEGGSQVHLARYEPPGRWSEDLVVSITQEILAERGLSSVVVDAHAENELLIVKLQDAGVDVVKLNRVDMANGSVAFTAGLVAGEVWHTRNAFLDRAVTVAAKRTYSDSLFIWSASRSKGDITPLRAVTAAWWAFMSGVGDDYDVEDSYL